MTELPPADLEYCQKYLKQFGSNYFLATKLFPKRIRKATIVLYSFFRYADEIVDSISQKQSSSDREKFQEIQNWIIGWRECWNTNGYSKEPILRATYTICQKYSIPFEYTEKFLDSMLIDTEKTRYTTYAELENYMMGSATVVGYMMMHVIGYTDPSAFAGAKALAEAMQLTNFLRDIDEDYQGRGRIYLPKQDMHRYGVTEEMITKRKATSELKRLIKDYIQHCRNLYKTGNSAINLLHEDGQPAVYLSSKIYSYHLTLLEQSNYNPFTAPRKVPKWYKVSTAAKVWLFGAPAQLSTGSPVEQKPDEQK